MTFGRGVILKQFCLLYKHTLWGLQHLPSQGTTTDLHYFLLKPVWFAIKKKSSWSVLLPQLTTRWKSFSIRCLLIRKSTNKKNPKHPASFQENVLEGAKADSHPISKLFWRFHQFWFDQTQAFSWEVFPFPGRAVPLRNHADGSLSLITAPAAQTQQAQESTQDVLTVTFGNVKDKLFPHTITGYF